MMWTTPFLTSVLVWFSFYACPVSSSVTVKSVGAMKISNPAFLRLVPNIKVNRTGYDLVITTFDSFPFTIDHVRYVPDVGRHLEDPANWRPRLITDRPRFPNEVDVVPVSPVTISSQVAGEEWFYHRVEWVDMNGDGRKDALTARAHFNLVGASSKSQLVWFEQPSSSSYPALSPSWKGHVISDCADLFFRSANLNFGGKNKTVIFSAGYFTKKLCVTWTEDPDGDWSDEKKIVTRTIDDELGVYYSVEVADINGDKRRELLVTVSNPENGTVLVYEIPDDVRKGSWERRVICDNFTVPGVIKSKGQGSPGLALPFYTSVANRYERKSFNYCHGVVGNGFQIGDVNNDGILELFLPCYSRGEIDVYQVIPN
uniref:FG-GAP repeat protein n=1 Tax=Branchiostoma floridae TaxID=7739 RepID=C3YKW4_BRAFL|eukprot:XP_002603171.1 hypothetical protein BRAFLDRAFT_63196 [Branchiostoma floridae]